MALQDTSLGEETKVGRKKRLFKGRDEPRVSSEERKMEAHRRGKCAVKYQEGSEREEMKAIGVKDAKKRWTKAGRDGKHQHLWRAGR